MCRLQHLANRLLEGADEGRQPCELCLRRLKLIVCGMGGGNQGTVDDALVQLTEQNLVVARQAAHNTVDLQQDGRVRRQPRGPAHGAHSRESVDACVASS